MIEPGYYSLKGGPQDGGKVTIGGDQDLPPIIYLGPKWLGDGFSAWARESSKRFPAKYCKENGWFVFYGYSK